MSQSNMKLRLSVMENGQPVRVEELASDVVPIKVGRLSSSHLRFDDASVSRIHAVIEAAADGSFNLIDLGSASGTFVNGEKITKASIVHGDVLQFGNIVVNFDIVEQLAQETAPAMESLEFKEEATVISQAPSAQPAPVAQPAPQATFQQPVALAPQEPVAQPLQQADTSLPWNQPEPIVQPSYQTEPVAQPQQQAFVAAQPSYAASSVQVQDQGYNASSQTVTTAEGLQVEPFTLQGYYDEHGNYIPGYYDEHGQYHYGYGYYDDQGAWQVAQGYYDPQGEWVDQPLEGAGDQYFGPPDIDYYTESFFGDAGGDTLEVAMIWNDQVIAVNSYAKARSVIIGTDPKSDFFYEDVTLTQDPYPLVTYDGSGYSVVATEGMTGLVQNGQQKYTLQEAIAQGIARRSNEIPGAYAIPLSARTSVRLDVGESNFLVHFTDQPVLIGGGGMGVDWASVPYFVVSGVAHIAFLLLALTMPEDPNALDLDGIQTDNRFVQLMVTPEQEEEVKPDWLGAGDEAQEEAAKHKGEEGQAGKEDSDQTDNQMAIKGPTDNKELQLKKAQDTAVAMDAGALAVLGSQVSSPFGNANDSIGSDAIHALGNMEGASTGESRGFGGLGLAGAGRGGGGISERGLGMGNVETAGRGGGGRGGSDYGKGASDLGEKKARMPVIIPGKPEIRGSLDKEIIARVVRQHRNEIRYCYEKELQKNPKLAGQIKVKFTISGSGSVISAIVNGSTVKSSAVEGCVTEKIRRWVFPEPKGGGIVIVNYPFNFSS